MVVYYFKIEKNSQEKDVPVLDGFQILSESENNRPISRFSYNVETKELIQIDWERKDGTPA